MNPELYSVAVVPVDVVVQHLHERSIVLVVVFVPVELLLLEKPEEVLGHGVVEAVDLPRHRLSYPVVCEPRLIQLVLILPALVGMQYRFALADDSGLGELIQHVHRLRQVRMLRDVVADHLPGAEVDNRGEVYPSEGKLEFRDIRAHLEARLVGAEVSADEVRADPADLSLVGVVAPPSEGGLVADSPEQSSDLVPAHRDAHPFQGYDDSS